MDKPKVSVIIPVYNGEKYLVQCLQSVIEQDLEDIEIICVDDGSVDSTVGIIEKFQGEYENIVLLRQENQGAAIARNNALGIAKGKYVAFMDADDYYIDKTGLRMLFEICENTKLPICGSLKVNDKDGEKSPDKMYRTIFSDTKKCQKLKYVDYQYDYCYQCYLFRSSFLKEHSIFFPNLRRYQDPPFLARALWYVQEFMVAPIDLYCYRMHTDSRDFSFIQVNDILRGIMMNLQFAKEHHLSILYNRCIDRLNNDYYRISMDSIMNGNMSALKYLLEISEYLIDPELNKDEKRIDVLEKVKQILGKSQRGDYAQYRLPYEDISYGSKVAIYGAGHIGKTIVSIIEGTQYCCIVAWVDRQFMAFQEKGFSVGSPDCLEETDFDYILVAIENDKVFEEIKDNLVNKGWNKNKPILRPIHL